MANRKTAEEKYLESVAQLHDNEFCIKVYNAGMKEFSVYSNPIIKKFRNCTAETIETENYILLRSYSTVVAVYDKISNVVVDILRYVYGYTATSNQHINKFYKEMSFNHFCCSFVRYRR